MEQQIIRREDAVKLEHSMREFDRVSGQYVTHHERWGMTPTTVQANFSMLCKYRAQPYVRWLDALTAEWTPLETGWIPREHVGQFVIENRTQLSQHVNPTEEEKAEFQKKIIEISFDGQTTHLEVPPGLFQPALPAANTPIYLRALVGPVNATVTIYPK